MTTANKREREHWVCSCTTVLSAVKIKVPPRTHRPNRKTICRYLKNGKYRPIYRPWWYIGRPLLPTVWCSADVCCVVRWTQCFSCRPICPYCRESCCTALEPPNRLQRSICPNTSTSCSAPPSRHPRLHRTTAGAQREQQAPQS